MTSQTADLPARGGGAPHSTTANHLQCESFHITKIWGFLQREAILHDQYVMYVP